MIETLWRDNRASILIGLLGAIALWLMLAFAVLFIIGMSHCTQCNHMPFLLRGFGVSLVFALLFAVAAGFGAAGLLRLLRPYLGARGTIALLVLLTLGLAVLAVPVGFYSIMIIEHQLEKAKEDAALAKLRELCPDRSRHLSIIHDELPRPLPRYTFVGEVRFEEADVTSLYQGGVSARVIRVIQGDPAIRILDVERFYSDRCEKAFENGSRGLIVAIPHERPSGDRQKVKAIFARRGDGFRLPDGFQIEEWQRPYWLTPPRPSVPEEARGKAATGAESGGASTSSDSGNAMVVPTAPTVVEARGPLER